ncbi:Communesin biosynthesis cluster-specific transcription factor cnsN [Paramyrothecium foliicola]|nr:Communesin biosynthesis cluster-specific transcription factor cnsN [Paramyrothecium foliicola]
MALIPPPFTVQILAPQAQNDGLAASTEKYGLLLPATHRTREDDIVVPQPDPSFLEKELSVKRINDIHDWLWLCGRPMPPRPLHHQRLLSREISITEDIGLHLVWWRNRIYIKPLPPYILDPDFWKAHITDGARLSETEASSTSLDAAARGFLFSYTALIAYESDFRVAMECGLLPSSLTWRGWKILTAEFLASHSYDRVNPRYWYGELRLSRLNKLYRIVKGSVFRGYSRVASHAFYGSFLQDQFALLAGILGYVVIVLTALQVGLSVEQLAENQAFQNVSYGLTVFALISPLIGAVFIFLVVLAMYLNNWMATKMYEKRRFYDMGPDKDGQIAPSSSLNRDITDAEDSATLISSMPLLGIGQLLDSEQHLLPEGAAALNDMTMQFINDFDIDGSDYQFMFRTPRSPSLDITSQKTATSSVPESAGIVLDGFTNLRPEALGLSSDMDPFLLQRYRTDTHGTFKFKQLSIQSVQKHPFPVQFLASHPSLFARNRREAGHDVLPDSQLREDLEHLASKAVGRRLIALYQRFVSPQYPIFSTEQLPDPTDAPPSLLAAIYSISFPFAVYDEQLSIDIAYDSPPYAALSRIIDAVTATEIHTPNLALVQTLFLTTARASPDPHVSDASYRWSLLGMLVAAATNIGLHLDPTAWSISSWQISQRKRLSFAIYSLDRWLSASLGRPPIIGESNWLVTSLQAEDNHCSGTSEAQWLELLAYSDLTSLLAQSLLKLHSLQAVQECLKVPSKGAAIADELITTLKSKNYLARLQDPQNSSKSMLSAVLCLGHHYIILLTMRASLHPLIQITKTSSEYQDRTVKMKHALADYEEFLRSIRTDELNGFWPPWCQGAFSSFCFTQLLMAANAATADDATYWVQTLQETRRQLRLKSNSLPILRLGLLRIDAIFWRGVDQVLHLEDHVTRAFKEGGTSALGSLG